MANNDKTWTIDQQLEGYFMCWDIVTQTATTFDLLIKDNSKSYVKVSKVSTDPGLALLSKGSAYKAVGPLKINIHFESTSMNVKSISTNSIIATDNGTIGYTYSFAIEDSYDGDYNDVYINISFWKTAN